jgi:hypothetical protein
MKKIAAVMLAILMLFVAVSCVDTGNGTESSAPESSESLGGDKENADLPYVLELSETNKYMIETDWKEFKGEDIVWFNADADELDYEAARYYGIFGDNCHVLFYHEGWDLDFACAVADLFNMTLITSEQGKTSIRGAEYAASRLMAHGAIAMRLVICAFDLRAVKKENRAGMIEMIDSSALVCIGVVPFDEKLQGLQDKGKISDEKSTTSIAYRNIATRLSGYDVKLFDGMGILSKLRKLAL